MAAKAKKKTAKTGPASKNAAKKGIKNAAKPSVQKMAPKPAAKNKTVKTKIVKAKATKSRYELKTKETTASVDSFIAAVDNQKRREQAEIALKLLARITGETPRLWGPSIVGFGRYTYTYESGHSGEMCVIGFSPRKAQFVFYLLGHPPMTDPVWSKLGKYKMGGSCLYVNKFEDIDMGVLETLITRSVATMRAKYPTS